MGTEMLTMKPDLKRNPGNTNTRLQEHVLFRIQGGYVTCRVACQHPDPAIPSPWLPHLPSIIYVFLTFYFSLLWLTYL